MGEYTDGIERINIELSIKNKLQLVDELHAFFARGNLPLGKSDDADGEGIADDEMLGDRAQQADELLDARAGALVAACWRNLDSRWREARARAGDARPRPA